MFFIFLLFGMDVLCEYDALDIHYQCVFWRVSKGLHPDLHYPNDVHIFELKDHARNKFLDQMLRKGGAGGGQHDGNGGCDGHGRFSNDDDKNVPFGDLCHSGQTSHHSGEGGGTVQLSYSNKWVHYGGVNE